MQSNENEENVNLAKEVIKHSTYTMGDKNPKHQRVHRSYSGCDINVWAINPQDFKTNWYDKCLIPDLANRGDKMLDLQAFSIAKDFQSPTTVNVTLSFVILGSSYEWLDKGESKDLFIMMNDEFGQCTIAALLDVKPTTYNFGASVDNTVLTHHYGCTAKRFLPIKQLRLPIEQNLECK